jgi:hypothetical protein
VRATVTGRLKQVDGAFVLEVRKFEIQGSCGVASGARQFRCRPEEDPVLDVRALAIQSVPRDLLRE